MYMAYNCISCKVIFSAIYYTDLSCITAHCSFTQTIIIAHQSERYMHATNWPAWLPTVILIRMLCAIKYLHIIYPILLGLGLCRQLAVHHDQLDFQLNNTVLSNLNCPIIPTPMYYPMHCSVTVHVHWLFAVMVPRSQLFSTPQLFFCGKSFFHSAKKEEKKLQVELRLGKSKHYVLHKGWYVY